MTLRVAAAALFLMSCTAPPVTRNPSGEARAPLRAAAQITPAQAAVFSAVASGDHVRVAQVALAAGPGPFYDEIGFTPLIWAAGQTNPKVAAELLSLGHDPSAPAVRGGGTPLMMAALHGRRETVDLLLSAGADPTARAVDGSTAEYAAVSRGYAEVAARLRAASANGATGK